MKITIKDIAKEANVSVTTVSLVLNHKPCRVAQETRDTIFAIAKKHHYRVNQSARSLVTKESKLLGLIIPDIENIFFSSLSKNIEEYCRNKGYALMIMNTNDKLSDDLMLLDLLVSRGVDGLFITVSNESFEDSKKMQEALGNLTIPYVMIDRFYPEINSNRVYFDNEKGVFLAIQHFVERGHTKIACIGGPESSKNGASRTTGYKKAMQYFHLPIKPEYIEIGDYRYHSGYEAGQKLIQTDAEAIFVSNDMMTLGLIKCLSEHQLRIPQDISIISYDNLLYPYMQGSEITSVDQNVKKLAIESCKVLLSHIEHEDLPCEDVRLEPHLIIKDSVQFKK